MRTREKYKKTMEIPMSLPRAAKENDLQTISFLLSTGHEIDAPDHRGYTPLMLAAYCGNVAALNLLIENVANLDKSDDAGSTPLMGVAFKGYTEIAQLLIAAGANVHLKNKAGMDALEIAHTFGRNEIAKLLAFQGAKKRNVWRLKSFFQLCYQQVRSKLSLLKFHFSKASES